LDLREKTGESKVVCPEEKIIRNEGILKKKLTKICK